MKEIHKAFKNSLKETLLGRLRLKLFKEITQVDNFMPDKHEAIGYILQEHHKSSDVGKFLGLLINHNSTKFVDFSELALPKDIFTLLSSLEDQPIEKPIFIEIKNAPKNYPQSLGAFVYIEDLDPSGYIYVMTITEEDHFPIEIAGRVEIRASSKFPDPAFSIWEKDTWRTYNWYDVQEDEFLSLFLKLLNYIDSNRPRYFVALEELSKEEMEFKNELKPPSDKMFSLLFKLVVKGKLICTKASVDISLVKPFSYDFALSYPKDVIDEAIYLVKEGKNLDLVVYWNKDCFVMSDDYFFYLAYRKLKMEKIPVVIMGHYPEEMLKPIAVGGIELIPPLYISHSGSGKISPDLVDYELDKRLEDNRLSDIEIDLICSFLYLSTLIQDPRTLEKELHKVILSQPVLIDPYSVLVTSEVRLGDEYRVDLVIQYGFSDKRILLIELEKANYSIFTKHGRPRAEVTHAVQQVEDWLRWWNENPEKIPEPLDKKLPVDGIVVMGRKNDMDEAAQRRLLSLNHNRKVQVITYDDLLDRLQNLIINLIKMAHKS